MNDLPNRHRDCSLGMSHLYGVLDWCLERLLSSIPLIRKRSVEAQPGTRITPGM